MNLGRSYLHRFIHRQTNLAEFPKSRNRDIPIEDWFRGLWRIFQKLISFMILQLRRVSDQSCQNPYRPRKRLFRGSICSFSGRLLHNSCEVYHAGNARGVSRAKKSACRLRRRGGRKRICYTIAYSVTGRIFFLKFANIKYLCYI